MWTNLSSSSSLCNTIDGRGVATSRLNYDSQRLVESFTKLSATNEGSILIATNLEDWHTLATEVAEEEEAEIDGRVLVPTW